MVSSIDIKNGFFVVNFAYDPVIVGLIKTLVGKRWDQARKVWLVPATIDNLRALRTILGTPVISDAALAVERQVQVDINKDITDYKFKTKPFDHQLKGFNYFRALGSGLVAWEMGTGKTKLAIDLMSCRAIQGEVKKILVCCPSSILNNWCEEIQKHSPFPTSPVILRGTRKHKINQLCKNQLWTIANYDTIGTLTDETLAAGFDAVIADESLKIKNPVARRSKALHKIGEAVKYRLAMSGTPITQNPTDIFSQFKFVNPAIFGRSFVAFRCRYLEMGGYGNYQVKGIKNVADLTSNIYRCTMRVSKQDCLDLPDKVYERREVDMSAEQERIYMDMANLLIAEFQETVITAPIILTKLLRLQQITGGCFSGIKDGQENKAYINDNNKMFELLECLQEIGVNHIDTKNGAADVKNGTAADVKKNDNHTNDNHKVIIWARFVDELKLIKNVLDIEGYKSVLFYGDVPVDERQGLVDEFNNNPEINIFIGQVQTGGIGINLTAADYAIFYSNTFSYSDRIQAEDRCHRIGSEVHKKITYIDIVCKASIDTLILDVIGHKGDMAKEIMADIRKLEYKTDIDNKTE